MLNTLLWGSTFVIIKDALGGISPMLFVAFRFFIAGLLLLAMFRSHAVNFSANSARQGIILGVLLFLGFAAQTVGLVYTTATKSAFITGTFVVFTPLLQTLMERKVPAWQNLLGIAFVLVGLVFLSAREGSFFFVLSEISRSFTIGDFLTLLCAICYAMYMVYLDMISAANDYRFLTFMQIIVTGVLGFVFTFFFNAADLEPARFTWSGSVLFAILYTTVFTTVLTTTLQTKFQKFVTPVRASIIFSLEPIWAAFFAWLVLGELFSGWGWLGAGLIFTGLLASEVLGRQNGNTA